MGLKQNIFYALPYPLKNLLVSAVAYKNSKSRKGTFYDRYLQLFRKSWYYKPAEAEALQSDLLRKLLLESFQYSEYYAKVFKGAGIGEDEIKQGDPIELVGRLPYLEKATLKTSLERIENKNPERQRDVINFTSGTTGTPTTVYYDKESMQMSFALWRRFHEVIGLPKSFKTVRLSGKIFAAPTTEKPPFWVYNMVDRQLLMSTYHLSESRLPAYFNKIKEFKPELIDGYPSAVYILAKFINAHNINLGFKPVAIATTAETLYDYQRAEIEKAFQCKAYNQYASSEGGAFITECKNGSFHINIDSGYFEFMNLEGQPARPGEYAELVISSFRNMKTPLIRYKSKDIVQLAEEQRVCGCGCHMPVVKQIIGREEDILFTEDKGYVGRMDTAYKGLTGIERSQIIQRSPELIDIYQIVNQDYDKQIEQKFLVNLRERLGNKVAINIHLVDDIPLSKNGKFKAVIRDFKLQDFSTVKPVL